MLKHPAPEQVSEWQAVAAPAEGGAVCFDVSSVHCMGDGRMIEMNEQGFMIRFNGKLMAWHNVCPHAGSPLDWIPGQFFSEDGPRLVCHTHGACFDPVSGDCLSGPCERGLYALPIREECGQVLVPLKLSHPDKPGLP